MWRRRKNQNHGKDEIRFTLYPLEGEYIEWKKKSRNCFKEMREKETDEWRRNTVIDCEEKWKKKPYRGTSVTSLIFSLEFSYYLHHLLHNLVTAPSSSKVIVDFGVKIRMPVIFSVYLLSPRNWFPSQFFSPFEPSALHTPSEQFSGKYTKRCQFVKLSKIGIWRILSRRLIEKRKRIRTLLTHRGYL